MKQTTGRSVKRRAFLKNVALATGLVLVKPESVRGTTANSALKLGVIGCGGRGNFVMRFFQEHTNSRLLSLADPFSEKMEGMGKGYGVEPRRQHGGLDGYEDVVTSDLDVVIITSPPYFHPEQVRAAVDAGKHVWCAKPVAVDVPGAKSIIESGELAKERNLSLFVDFQTRNSPAFLEAVSRVHRGDIGKLVTGQIYYQTGRLRARGDPKDTSPRGRLRNWVFDKVLSGDIIVEQNVHVLDVSDWYVDARPVRAFGTGGRKGRVDVGDCWDHFLCIYWYPDGTRMDFCSGQYVKGYNDLCMRVYGTKGTVDSHYGGVVRITGDNPWQGVERDNTFREPVQRNAKMFEESVRGKKPLINTEASAESTLTTILGRTAAYGEREVTREEILKANVKLEANLNL